MTLLRMAPLSVWFPRGGGSCRVGFHCGHSEEVWFRSNDSRAFFNVQEANIDGRNLLLPGHAGYRCTKTPPFSLGPEHRIRVRESTEASRFVVRFWSFLGGTFRVVAVVRSRE